MVMKKPAAVMHDSAEDEGVLVVRLKEPEVVTEELVLRLDNTDIGAYEFVNLGGAKINLRDDDDLMIGLTWDKAPQQGMQPVLMVKYDEEGEGDFNNGLVLEASFSRWMSGDEWAAIVEANDLTQTEDEQ